MQSVNPPVEEPTSRHSFPARSIFQCASARSSFNPPRLTYFRSCPSRRIAQAAATCAPALSTNMLKTFPDQGSRNSNKTCAQYEKSRPSMGGLLISRLKKLSGHFFQQLLIDVEVRVHVLHVVVLFERFHQTDHGIGSLAFQ